MAYSNVRQPASEISRCAGRPTVRPRPLVSRQAFSRTAARQSPQPGREGPRDTQTARDAAKLGLLVIFQAVAATKLHQASAVRALPTNTAVVTQAPGAPDTIQHGLTPSMPPTIDNSHSQTDSSSSPCPESQPALFHHTLTLNDTLLEAALWTDELRDMQSRRTQLQAELDELTQTLRSTLQPAAPATLKASTSAAVTGPQAEAYFVSTGAEFCALTWQVEACREIEQIRSALRQQIHALSSHLLARASASPQPLQLQFMDRVLDPAPVVGRASPSQAQVKKLQSQWTAAAQDVTHLLVRIVQLQQLPGQPKARVTVAYVKEKVIQHMHERQAYLSQDDDI